MKAKELQELGKWKVGQPVAFFSYSHVVAIHKISRITDGRGGTIYTARHNLAGESYETPYDIDGRPRGSDKWVSTRIEPATETHLQTLKEAKAFQFLQSFKWVSLSPS